MIYNRGLTICDLWDCQTKKNHPKKKGKKDDQGEDKKILGDMKNSEK